MGFRTYCSHEEVLLYMFPVYGASDKRLEDLGQRSRCLVVVDGVDEADTP